MVLSFIHRALEPQREVESQTHSTLSEHTICGARLLLKLFQAQFSYLKMKIIKMPAPRIVWKTK